MHLFLQVLHYSIKVRSHQGIGSGAVGVYSVIGSPVKMDHVMKSCNKLVFLQILLLQFGGSCT